MNDATLGLGRGVVAVLINIAVVIGLLIVLGLVVGKAHTGQGQPATT